MAIEYRLSYTAADIDKKLGAVDALSEEMKAKQDKLTFDTTPTADSDNPVTSGGIYNALENKQPKGDYALSRDIPDVPDWALRTEKPVYTAAEVGAATEYYVDNKISEMIDSAPEALDTLNKLSAALGDDANFAATVTEQIGNKVDKISGMGLSSNDFTDAEKAKLSGIAEEANNYVLPVATSSALGGVRSGTDITIDANGNVTVNDDSHNHIISNVDGLQEALDTKQPVGDYALNSDIPFIYAWAKEENKPTYTAEEVGALPNDTYIPTKTSDLTNDSGFITEYIEDDPTVPAWAKSPVKPRYTAEEVGALPNTTVIPNALSDLSEDDAHRVVTDIEKAAWNAKSDFSGSYNDLTDKPTIPSIDGLATEDYVDTKVDGITVESIGALPNTTVIPTVPTNISAFTNDAGYLTEHQSLDGLATEDYVDTQIAAIPTPDVSGQINTHNTDTNAHNDIRNLIGTLRTEVGTLPEGSTATSVVDYINIKTAGVSTDADLAELQAQVDNKAEKSHTHTKSEVGLGNVDDTADAEKSVLYATSAGSAETSVSATKAAQDASGNVITSTYETKSDADAKLADAKSYTDTKTSDLASTSSVNTGINTHNTSTTAHNDIRDLISELTNRLNALADSDDTTLDQMSEVVAYIKSNKSLIDSITTSKVNVSDIVNNLTTSVTNKPLSAAQGVALKALIDGLEKADVGLGNVDNTSDANKPVSTAQATAIADAKKAGTDAQANLTTHNTDSSAHTDIRSTVSAAQAKADNAYTLAESKVDSLSDLGITATATELNYMDGVTSNVQTQLDGKSNSGHTHSASEITAGTLNGSLTIGSGKVLDFVTMGGKFRIMGGGSTDTASIRLVDNGNHVIEDILQVNVNTGEITGGNLKTALDGKADKAELDEIVTEEAVILPHTSLTVNVTQGDGKFSTFGSDYAYNQELVVGGIYEVEYDGEKYTCTAVDSLSYNNTTYQYTACLGGINEGYPFIIGSNSRKNALAGLLTTGESVAATQAGTATHTISIKIPRTINPELIPTTLATKDYVNAAIAAIPAPDMSSKQDKITGTPGDFVVIGDDGNMTTKTIARAEEVAF